MYDADGHIIEDMRDIFGFFEPPYKDGVALRHGLEQGHGLWPELDGFHRQALAARGGATTEWWTSADQWLSLLDETGLDGTVLYPTMGLAHGRIRDARWSVALARAYNDWMAARYASASPRLRFVALLPLQDPSAAAEELDRAVTVSGAVGGLLAAAGMREALGAPLFFPLYERAQALGVPLVVHGAPADVLPDIFDRFAHLHVLTHPVLQMISMTSMFKAGIFDRFPTLRVGFFEAGCSWVPFLVSRLDRTTSILGHDPYDVYGTGSSPSLPGDVVRDGRVFFSVEGDEPLIEKVLDQFGPQCLCFASDFPHEQGSPKEVLREIGELRDHDELSLERKQRVLNDNAHLLYGGRL